jgi:aerobic-type carbon monoxide dehydrogenase small subunit (CoxS/CutS family)
MILAACSLLRDQPDPSDEAINAAMSESVCRCGTYPRMRKAIKRAAAAMREQKA